MRIDVITPAQLSDVATAWRLSRDLNVETPFLDVARVDAPVNEMASALLHFQDMTILEREIFASQRNHVMWARTSRVDDPLQFKVPKSMELKIDIQGICHQMIQQKAAGVHQDQWRMALPVMALTSFVMRLSMRDTVKLAAYFHYLADRAPFTVANRFYDLAVKLLRVFPYSISYQLSKLLYEGTIFFEGTSTIGQFATVGLSVPLALRAQAVRHRPISFVDNLFSKIIQPDVFEMNLGTSIQMELCAANEFWNTIVKKRSCWIAQFDLWRPVIELLAKDTSKLPCSEGTCPFNADAMLRVEGKDPAPPCPIHLELNQIDKEPWRERMKTYAADRPQFWQERIAR